MKASAFQAAALLLKCLVFGRPVCVTELRGFDDYECAPQLLLSSFHVPTASFCPLGVTELVAH